MAKAEAKAQDTAPEQQAVPIVFTLASDHTFATAAEATAAPYSWSKDGAAASSAQWVLPPVPYDLALNWTLTAAGTAIPSADLTMTYTTSSGVGLTPSPVWLDNGDGTYSGTAAGIRANLGYAASGKAFDVRYYPTSSPVGIFPVTLKAGSTVTLTPVLAAAPPVHTIVYTDHDSFNVGWSPTAQRDVEVDGVLYSSNRGSPCPVTARQPSTTYQTRTRLYSPQSEWTAAVPVTTSPPPGPAVPTNVVVSDIEMTGFTVTCDDVAGATKYEVRTVEGMV